MKNIRVILGTALSCALLAGCATTPVALAPVGPNPAGSVSATANGQLEVFSLLQSHRDGNEYDPNPPWYQHTDYNVYDMQGREVRHVFNSIGHYAQTPNVATLPEGRYRVVAWAQGYVRVSVPVVIERGRTTRVHLDNRWQAPLGTPMTQLVQGPNGRPIGWRAE